MNRNEILKNYTKEEILDKYIELMREKTKLEEQLKVKHSNLNTREKKVIEYIANSNEDWIRASSLCGIIGDYEYYVPVFLGIMEDERYINIDDRREDRLGTCFKISVNVPVLSYAGI